MCLRAMLTAWDSFVWSLERFKTSSLKQQGSQLRLTSASAWAACWWSRSCRGGWAEPPRRWPGWRRATWTGARRSHGSWTCSAALCWTSGWSCDGPAECWTGEERRADIKINSQNATLGPNTIRLLEPWWPLPSFGACTAKIIRNNINPPLTTPVPLSKTKRHFKPFVAATSTVNI